MSIVSRDVRASAKTPRRLWSEVAARARGWVHYSYMGPTQAGEYCISWISWYWCARTINACEINLGHTEAPAIRKAVHSPAHHLLQWSSDKYFERPDRPKATYSGDDITPKSSFHLAQNFRQLSGPVSEQEPTEGCTSTAVAANLSIGFWKDYALFSKLLYK